MDFINSFVSALIVGLVLLTIEYWTGWFANTVGVPDIKTRLLRHEKAIHNLAFKTKRIAVDIIGFFALWHWSEIKDLPHLSNP